MELARSKQGLVGENVLIDEGMYASIPEVKASASKVNYASNKSIGKCV